MANNTNGNQFREDEIVVLTHWDKREEKWVKNIYPKVGGRLRLAHEENDQLSISTKIIKYDEGIAVVMAVTTTMKGDFPGYGMASVERDQTIAPAILELAETRAISRSLRFAGYGVEYCSAEEISHLENGNGKGSDLDDKGSQAQPPGEKPKSSNGGKPGNGGRNTNKITDPQKGYIETLGSNLGWDPAELNKESVRIFGNEIDFLTIRDASSLIDVLKTNAENPIHN